MPAPIVCRPDVFGN